MGFDKTRFYEVLLWCVMPVMAVGTLCGAILLFWAFTGNVSWYETHDPLLNGYPTVSAVVIFTAYFVGFVCSLRKILFIKKQKLVVIPENG